jgi:uncharacterized C2H2 Zn-finger protein
MMALSESDWNSLNVYRDLVVFHSFVTHKPLSMAEPIAFRESHTYIFAETIGKALCDDSKLTLLKPTDLRDEGVDFDRFPVAINVGMKPVYRYVNYKDAFVMFLQLKAKIGSNEEQKRSKKLYDQIHLWEFVRNFGSIHRIYSNDYLPIALCMTILESLIGRPEKCKNAPRCPKCNNIMEHDTESWTKHFRKHHIRQISSRNIRIISDIRNETYHRGILFDWFEEHDEVNTLGDQAADEKTKKFDELTFVQEELLQMSRRKLIHEFLRRYSAT